MPLDAITIDGWRDATRSADCCGDATVVRRVVANADDAAAAWGRPERLTSGLTRVEICVELVQAAE